jgi:transposase
MDNARIHKQIEDMLNQRNRDNKCTYLPPYLSELNPIEKFWVLVKCKVRRQKLKDTETLQEGISDAAKLTFKILTLAVERLYSTCFLLKVCSNAAA